jgi:hypothetical protein
VIGLGLVGKLVRAAGVRDPRERRMEENIQWYERGRRAAQQELLGRPVDEGIAALERHANTGGRRG